MQWESVEHFNSVQKKWSVWGVAIVIGIFVIGILAAIAIPAYQDYVERAKQAELNQAQVREESAEATPQEQESLKASTTSSEDVSSEATEEVFAEEKWTAGYAPGENSSSSKDSASLQDSLINALRRKAGSTERMGDSRIAILGYVNAGYVSKQPDQRVDYSDYRVLKKPADFMGHTLVAIEEEYFDEWIGCCVSPGMAVTVRLNSGGQDLADFASKSGCRLSLDSEEFSSVPDHLVPKLPKGSYATVTCKERDLQLEE